ncbi:hypothetical protein ONZ43_g7000 [Nemania bipapillata]|uniref:Uncharacterized protein n=1 Tax=Nemania bipapillata TaxID=110536 RepID=A0ACC2HUH9_9PEZI|nr:hypothetical protein ONZ43_g7000 [Nemania bipapillata]
MAASRRGQPELHVRLPSTPSVVTLPDLPPISALFLIDFDVKAGYTISWKAAKPGVELEGVVEYKSLPSGLHTVSEDLIYFVHDGYAGLSAFVNAPVEDTAARNARMLAVGVLVPLSCGRLGRAWKHAESLKAIASKMASNSKDIGSLEEYWEKNQARDDDTDDGTAPRDDPESPLATLRSARTPRSHIRNRSASDGTALMLPGHKLSPFHPAWSLTKLLDAFDASPSDSESEVGTGWVACTTDSILSKKDELWDVLITMPPPHASNAKKRVWPTVELPHGIIVKATQRDMRRFRSLKAGMARMEGNVVLSSPSTPQTVAAYKEDEALLDDAEQVVEPTSWTALAYSGFMWWASAGEKPRSDEAEEAAQDASLLSDLAASSIGISMPRTSDIAASISSLTPRRSSTTASASASASASAPLEIDEARVELAIISYFHRLTTQLLGSLADAIDNTPDGGLEDESPMEEDDALIDAEEDDAHGVQIDTDVMKRMGLDIWSASDAEFVKELLRTYFGRQAYIEGKGVEVCGIRVC